MNRNPLVDVLRGISILLVLILHFHLAYHLDYFRLLARNGNYGVTIFFVISGFLITGISRQRFGDLKSIQIGRFYLYRFARIMPNILLMVTLVMVGWSLGYILFQNLNGTATKTMALLSIFTFWHNILMQKYGYFNYCLNILWSLSVEEVFYLLFPLACVFVKDRFALFGLFVFCIIFAPIYRFMHRTDEIIALYDYRSCFDGLAIGCLAAALPSEGLRRYARTIASAAVAVMILVYFIAPIMANVVLGVSLMALATGALVFVSPQLTFEPSAQFQPLLKPMNRALQWMGRHSYELYLFHIVVLASMRMVVRRHEALAVHWYGKPLWFALYVVLSLIVSALIARFYAEPLNRTLRALAPAKR